MSYGTNTPFGFKPVQYIGGSTWSGQVQSFFIPSPVVINGGINLYTNDAVIPKADGSIDTATLGGNVALCGTFQGCSYTDASGVPQTLPYLLNGTVTLGNNPVEVFVTADPAILYEVQVSISTAGPNAIATANLQKTFVNNNGYINVGGPGAWATFPNGITPPANPATGSTLTGLSAMYIDYPSIGAGNAQYPLKIWSLTPNIYNGIYQATPGTLPQTSYFNTCLVLFNNDNYKGGTGTIGV